MARKLFSQVRNLNHQNILGLLACLGDGWLPAGSSHPIILRPVRPCPETPHYVCTVRTVKPRFRFRALEKRTARPGNHWKKRRRASKHWKKYFQPLGKPVKPLQILEPDNEDGWR
jgi:hypothetical protein